MAKKLQCPRCDVVYEFDKNSATCPHEGFPRVIKCQKHQRVNCGNSECQTNLVIMPKKVSTQNNE